MGYWLWVDWVRSSINQHQDFTPGLPANFSKYQAAHSNTYFLVAYFDRTLFPCCVLIVIVFVVNDFFTFSM